MPYSVSMPHTFGMATGRTLPRPIRPGTSKRTRWSALALVALLTACGGGGTARPPSTEAGPEHGLVLTRTTERYLIVMDILAPERMYTDAEVQSLQPSTGELVVRGRPGPIDSDDTRHMEVHIYGIDDGKPVVDASPVLTLIDHTGGHTYNVDATLMHDIVIGMPDAHYGTNTRLPAGHSFTLRVQVGDDRTEFDGVLP